MEVLFIMKKVLAVVLTVCVVLAAGSALAQQRHPEARNFEGREHINQQQQNRPDAPNFNGREMRRDFRPCRFEGKRSMFTPDMPKEIREKVAEYEKLKIDMKEILFDKNIDKGKALEIHKKMQKLENEIGDWKFEKRLERIEDFKKQMELKRNEKPVPPAPKPENEPK